MGVKKGNNFPGGRELQNLKLSAPCSIMACTVFHYPTRANVNIYPHSCMASGMRSTC